MIKQTFENITVPTIGHSIQVELPNNTTATITRVRAAYGNKREAMYTICIERGGERLFQTNRRGDGAWKSIKNDMAIYM